MTKYKWPALLFSIITIAVANSYTINSLAQTVRGNGDPNAEEEALVKKAVRDIETLFSIRDVISLTGYMDEDARWVSPEERAQCKLGMSLLQKNAPQCKILTGSDGSKR